jgi:hypothetical protein
MSSLVPITANVYNRDVSDLVLSFASTTTLGISTGYCLDSNKTTVMKVGTALVLNSAVVGENGIDTGALTTSTEYYVFIIASSIAGNDLDSTKAGVALLSLSATAPVMPSGYDLLRRIGVVKTDGSSHFLPFYQSGKLNRRMYDWDEPISVLSGGSSATLAAVVCTTACMKADDQEIMVQAAFTPNAANDTAQVVQGTSTATTGKSMSGPVAAKAATAFIPVVAKLVSGVPNIKYKVTASGALTLLVASFVDNI